MFGDGVLNRESGGGRAVIILVSAKVVRKRRVCIFDWFVRWN